MQHQTHRFYQLILVVFVAILLSSSPTVVSGQVKAWGNNQYGQLGTGDVDSRLTPVTLSGLNDIVDISAGPDTTIALRRNGTVSSWGSNRFGRLGTGSATPAQSNVPVPVIDLTGVKAVAAGGRVCMALKSDGTLWVWGSNYTGEFGNGTLSGQLEAFPTPRQVPGLPSIVAVSVTPGEHVLALDTQGRVWGWGGNTRGEVNFQNPALRVTTPEMVLGFPTGTVITQISSHTFISEALTSAGEVYVWGTNEQGEDGLGRCNLSQGLIGLPKRVIASGVAQIAASSNGMAALQTNGNVLYWGDNSYAQAGNNTSSICTMPVNATITGVSDIRSGDLHFLARKADGTIWGWGYNSDCQIGSGSCPFANQLPVQTQAGTGNGRIFDAGGRTGFISNPQAANRPFDLDGDGKTDLSIFRPNGAASEWWWLKSSTGGNAALQFGASTDRLTPVDFTGDGKTDVAFWRPSTGQWFILRSEDFSFYAFPFGTTGDVPVPADYDGDGKGDAAVFRASAATWYINKSSGGTDIIGFGAASDLPVNADYDGDGKADVAIYRPNGPGGAEWWVRRSSNASVFALQFGTSTDKAVPGDFTGDGKADVAFWRPSTGFWNILRSEDFSYYAFPFGANGDVASPGDYDGDGKLDAAVFRPSNATWYANRSTAGTLIQQFGATGDVPVPSTFVR